MYRRYGSVVLSGRADRPASEVPRMLDIQLIETIHRDRQAELERKLEIRRVLRDAEASATVSAAASAAVSGAAQATVPVPVDPVPDRSSICVSGVRSAAGGR
jgi:hypothetical protein